MKKEDIDYGCLLEMQTKLDRICVSIETLADKQQEMYDHIAKINVAGYNPEQGLYASIRE